MAAVRSAGWAAVGGFVFLALWQLVAIRSPDLPAPAEAASALLGLLAHPFADHGPNDKGIALQLAVSLRRVFTGFAAAALVGVPAGLLIGASPRAWRAVNPLVQVLRPVSPLAWFPIWLTVLKDAGGASVAVILITALWPIVLNTAAGAAAVPTDHRNVARVFHFGRVAYLRHVLLPDTLPSIVTGLRLSMGIAWMVIVAVEMLSGGSGIGFFVWDSYNAGNLAAVVAAIAIIGAIGVALDIGFLRVGRLVALESVRS
jgi:nitrate/nitrite transport system permease protein